MLNETKDFSGKYVRLYMGNGEFKQGKVWSVRKIGDHYQLSFDKFIRPKEGSYTDAMDKLEWHWADTRVVSEVEQPKSVPMPRRIVNFIIRALGYRMLNKIFRKIGM
jgi:hypothetical protein